MLTTMHEIRGTNMAISEHRRIRREERLKFQRFLEKPLEWKDGKLVFEGTDKVVPGSHEIKKPIPSPNSRKHEQPARRWKY